MGDAHEIQRYAGSESLLDNHSSQFSSQQKTIKAPATLSGIGLHSGAPVSLRLEPAPADHGIVFQRTGDLGSGVAAPVTIPALASHVVQTTLNTTIGTEVTTASGEKATITVATIEHLMAALAALDIHNITVVIDGPEVPIMDGSAEPFMAAIEQAGIEVLAAAKTIYRLKAPVTVNFEGKSIKASPYFGQKFSCAIDFDYRSIGYQKVVYNHSGEAFEHIARARTFCHQDDVAKLRENGLALGGSLDNAVVVSDDKVINENGLRVANEFVKHKLLDMIGDFWLLNMPLYAQIESSKSGHHLHWLFLDTILADAERYLEKVTLTPAPARKSYGLGGNPAIPEAAVAYPSS